MPLTIVADIRAVPEKADLVRKELIKLIAVTKAEAGCLQYDLHQDNADPAHFLFYETWETRELWQTHMAAPHLAAYLRAVEGAVAAFTIAEMQRLS